MQKNTPTTSTFVALIVIVVVALLLFFYYKGNPTDNIDSSLSTNVSPEAIQVTAESESVLALLNKINNLVIDDLFFKSSVYMSLVDYSIDIPQLSVGRANPFASQYGTVVPKVTKVPKPGP